MIITQLLAMVVQPLVLLNLAIRVRVVLPQLLILDLPPVVMASKQVQKLVMTIILIMMMAAVVPE
jgi:hypothetical protein